MERVKLSALDCDQELEVLGNEIGNCESSMMTAWEVINDIDKYRNRTVYTLKDIYEASFDAKGMIDSMIEKEANKMYEDWDLQIIEDVHEDDVKGIQKILEKILSRRENISARKEKLVIIDM